ncbi:hypothetical protein ASD83_18745 [Devosia sp. Root685]|uniref:DUF1223 domain-containing protein n=1 Tax=Devosia sp. Root685 TaxID=1736587 RepID=UPI0006FFC2BD|nr:DUF1223 domain-containing protein [Devosia sp. Root685]KRA95684.1 hypothetical protein ASD83_18745 [Devosia sp. Root685]
MIRLLPGLLLGLAANFVIAGPSWAQDLHIKPKAVVELFTSQGCASCPPADALLTALAERDDVVALAFHVDYWDYVGWKDTFAQEAYSDRQRAYAKGWGSSRIYTPQIVINGAKAVVGSRRNEVQQALDRASLPLAMDLTLNGDMLKISLPPKPDLSDAVVWLVTYMERADVKIDSGENAGKSMVYTQVVTGRQVLGMWESKTGAELKLPLGEVLGAANTGIAIVVQQERGGLPGAILAAGAYEP